MFGSIWRGIKRLFCGKAPEVSIFTSKKFKTEWGDLIEDQVKSGKYKNLLKWQTNPTYWRKFFYALCGAESSFNPYTRYEEQGLGNDMVTGLQNTSEGLTQVSYQDQMLYGCPFDWARDKNKDPKSPAKTIFQPSRNLKCALMILDNRIGKNGTPFSDSGNYWSVLMPKNKRRHKKFNKFFNSYDPSKEV